MSSSSLQAAWQMLRRDWRSGELNLLALALIVAVASISTVGLFTDRIQAAMDAQASTVLGADLVLADSRPAHKEWLTLARELGLNTAQTAEFPSVLILNDRPRLVQVKAVSASWPLRGKTETRPAQDTPPQPGEAWLEPRLQIGSGLQIGDAIALGKLSLRWTASLRYEPDRAANLFQLAPRLMIALQDLPASGLTGPASRVKYRLLLAGSHTALQQFRRTLDQSGLPRSARWLDVRSARPELRSALQRADSFLRLAALTAVLLAVVAVALGMRRFVDRQTDSAALLRCFGVNSRQIARIFAWRLLFIGLIAGTLGNLIGLLAQSVLTTLIAQWFTDQLPAPSWWPLINGLATSLLVLAGFALPALWRLARVSPLRVLRRELPAPDTRLWLAAGLPLIGLLSLMIIQLGNEALAWRLIGGLCLALPGFWLLSRLLLSALKGLRQASHNSGQGGWRESWRFGMAALARAPTTTSLQLSGFGIALTVLFILALVRIDLMRNWQTSLPDDLPNHFLINIQHNELAGIREFLDHEGLPPAPLYPVVRARLSKINARPVEAGNYEQARARRLAAREFNISWTTRLPEDNQIVRGRWWAEQDWAGLGAARPGSTKQGESPQLSLEVGLAKALKIEPGDVLEFDIAGQTVSAPVTSLRKVQWDSFNANFFVIATPGLLKDVPATWISSFYLPEGPKSEAMLARLVQNWPGVTPLNITALINQVRGIMDRGALAIEFVFLFTLLASLVVLYTGIQSSQQQRRQETALLRVLGLSEARILAATVVEFGLLGSLAAILAAGFAMMTGYGLANSVFNLPWSPDPLRWLSAITLAILGITLAGVLATRQQSRTPPAAVLRQ